MPPPKMALVRCTWSNAAARRPFVYVTWSYDAEASTDASTPAKATALTRCAWPSRRRTTRPVVTSQQNAARSPPHDAKVALSGAMATPATLQQRGIGKS